MEIKGLGRGITRDLNASGIYMVLPPGSSVERGEERDVVIEFDRPSPAGTVELGARFEVLRVEPLANGVGAAGRVVAWRFVGRRESGD